MVEEFKEFKVGDKVRPNAYWGGVYSQADWTKAVCTVTSVGETGIWVYNPVLGRQQHWESATSLERVEDKPVKTGGAMGRDTALAQRQRLIESGLFKPEQVSLDTRSWDAEARYFAVQAGDRRFVNIKQVDTFLAEQTPIDVEPCETIVSYGKTYYRFAIPDATPLRYLRFPNGAVWFTEGSMKQIGGIVAQDGKRYRLGRKVFVPFVDTAS